MNFSPAESFLSVDSDDLKSLFSNDTCSPSAIKFESSDEKKPVKKRKSWGQELPVPTTNLPPRKRAKTEAEKEQRRIERVLRNRAAAQSSRERKRKEVEALEDEKNIIKQENARLASRLAEVEKERMALHRKIMAMTAEMTVFRDMLGDKAPAPVAELDSLEFDFLPQPTLDPTDLLGLDGETTADARDVTQHPAVVLSFDLQCPSTISRRPHWSRRRSRSRTTLSVGLRPRSSSRSSRKAATFCCLTTARPRVSRSRLTHSSTLILTQTPSRPTSLTTPSRSSLSLCSPVLARPLVDATGALQRDSDRLARVVLEGRKTGLDKESEDAAETLRRYCAAFKATEEKRLGPCIT